MENGKLRQALDLLRDVEKWCKRDFVHDKAWDDWEGDDDPSYQKYPSYQKLSYCLLGAMFLRDVETKDYEWDKEVAILSNVVREHYGDRSIALCSPTTIVDIATPIVMFNDNDETTHDEVIQVLEKAVLKAEEMVEW